MIDRGPLGSLHRGSNNLNPMCISRLPAPIPWATALGDKYRKPRTIPLVGRNPENMRLRRTLGLGLGESTAERAQTSGVG